MRELILLWERTLGTLPSEQQFAIWSELHTQDIIRRAILKTAIKNQQLNGTMSSDHKFRFASRVMMTLTEQAAKNAANRERLRDEFEGASGKRWTQRRMDKQISEKADDGVMRECY
jgi:hypothetical protein